MKNFVEIRNSWFIQQIRKLEANGIKQADIAIELGVKPQYLNAILNGRRNASEKFIAKFCDLYGINQKGLLQQMKGYDDGTDIENLAVKESISSPIKSNEIRIPLVGILAVGGFGNAEFAIQKSDVKDFYVVPKFKDRRVDFMIEVSGSSMYPKYSPGDVVACTILKESKFIQWNKVHVIGTKEQGILIKRVKEGPEVDQLHLISDNKDYDPFIINKEEITGMALVVGVIRLE
jgi:phage repressor protein C with HTH and peptisase S24 domain